jgi:pSer/pThr/pTyr-binding forkhead associated (FHA) protein
MTDDKKDSVNDDHEGPQGTVIFSAAQVDDMLNNESATVITNTEGNAILTGTKDPFNGMKFELNKRKHIVGRKPDCDITLNEPSVSASHAELVNEAGVWKVVNLLSSNGTFINGKKIAVESLHHGDKVSFGRTEFTFKEANKSDNPTLPSNAVDSDGVSLMPIIIGATVITALIGTIAYFLMN